MRNLWTLLLPVLVLPNLSAAQEARYVADTIVVEAQASEEAEPDLATLVFHVSVQEKNLPRAYERATAALEKIRKLAERNGLRKDEVTAGAFTVLPIYDWADRKHRARAYRVENTVTMRLADFPRIGALVEGAVDEEIVALRSVSYGLRDEEAAKLRAVAAAMRRAEARAQAALQGNSRRLGSLRHASVDVKAAVPVLRQPFPLGAAAEAVEVSAGEMAARTREVPPLPQTTPEKIRISASVACVYQLQ